MRLCDGDRIVTNMIDIRVPLLELETTSIYYLNALQNNPLLFVFIIAM